MCKVSLLKAKSLVKKHPLNLLCTHGTKRIGNYSVGLLAYIFRFDLSCLIPTAVPNLTADVVS